MVLHMGLFAIHRDYAYVDQLLDLIGFARCRVNRDAEVLLEEGSVPLSESFQLVEVLPPVRRARRLKRRTIVHHCYKGRRSLKLRRPGPQQSLKLRRPGLQ